MQEPQPSDFDLKPDRVDHLRVSRRRCGRICHLLSILVVFLLWLLFVSDGEVSTLTTIDDPGPFAYVWGTFLGLFVVTVIGSILFGILQGVWEVIGCPTISVFRRLASYESALATFRGDQERQRAQLWTNLSGLRFEDELARLYRRLGYVVHQTPASGDGGIDLIIHTEGGETIVQCKRHAAPVGVAAARELYGTLVSSKRERAVLASTSGFTRGTVHFSRDKPIELLDLDGILRMQELASDATAKNVK